MHGIECYQIWRNFTTLSKLKKSLAIFKDLLFNILQKNKPFGQSDCSSHSAKELHDYARLGEGDHGQSYKHFTIVIYDPRVVIYERKLLIRLATGEPIK